MNPLVAAFLTATPSVDASLLGYSGLMNVPSAHTRQDLGLSFRWLDAPEALLQFTGTSRVDRMYIVSGPFLPFLEGAIGFVQVIGWVDPDVPLLPYAVHRAFDLKVRLPLDWAGPQIAAGVIDPISANFLASDSKLNTHYGLTTFYGVASQRLGPLELTAGYGQGDTSPGAWGRTKPFLHGPFGGAVWARPLGLEVMAEYDGATVNGGLRWKGPWGWGLQGGYVGGGWSAGTSLGVPL